MTAREAREAQGLTQKQMAKRFRVSVATVRNWERGEISYDHAVRIAPRWGCTTDGFCKATLAGARGAGAGVKKG